MSSCTIPSVIERGHSGAERSADVFSRLLSDRIVYVGTPIDDGVANTVIAQILHLENESADAPIHLYHRRSTADGEARGPQADTVVESRAGQEGEGREAWEDPGAAAAAPGLDVHEHGTAERVDLRDRAGGDGERGYHRSVHGEGLSKAEDRSCPRRRIFLRRPRRGLPAPLRRSR